jgi:hypothetical protein
MSGSFTNLSNISAFGRHWAEEPGEYTRHRPSVGFVERPVTETLNQPVERDDPDVIALQHISTRLKQLLVNLDHAFAPWLRETDADVVLRQLVEPVFNQGRPESCDQDMGAWNQFGLKHSVRYYIYIRRGTASGDTNETAS